MTTGSRFLDQTQVHALGGRADTYGASLTDDWNCPIVPHGGVVTAVALRAMAAALDHPDQRLRSVTATFVAAVKPGDVEIEVEVWRRGRSISQVSASLHNTGEPEGLRCTAVFGAERRGFEFTELEMPTVPPPEESPSWADAPKGFERQMVFNFWEQAESRMALGHLPWISYEPSTSNRANWFRFNEPPIVDGKWDPLGVVALCDTMPGAVAEKLGSGSGWLPPSADLTVHLFGDATSEWILGHNRAHHVGDGYASAETVLWDPAGHVLAFATQVMFFTFID
ncbi:MAG: thioesterase family protein [Actinobacteria bacterium]|nr:thioesterase family protein [Actinomycetota bacterium]